MSNSRKHKFNQKSMQQNNKRDKKDQNVNLKYMAHQAQQRATYADKYPRKRNLVELQREFVKLEQSLPQKPTSSSKNTHVELLAMLLALKFPLVGLAFACLIIGADGKKQKSIYEDICTDTSLENFNKPKNMRMAAILNDGERKCVPSTCENLYTEKDVETCTNDIDRLHQYQNQNQDKINDPRKQAQREQKKWLKRINTLDRKSIANEQWTPLQQEAYLEIKKAISNLKNCFEYAKSAKEFSGGNCDEQANIALIRLFQNTIKYGIDLKIQKVEVATTDSSNHVYLLINSNLKDIKIKNRDKIIEYLKSAKGKVCDPWNKGSYLNINKDTSNFYYPSSDAFLWEEIATTTFSLNFSKFNQLHPSAKKIICDELTNLGLFVDAQIDCHSFYAEKYKDEVQIPKVDNKLEF